LLDDFLRLEGESWGSGLRKPDTPLAGDSVPTVLRRGRAGLPVTAIFGTAVLGAEGLQPTDPETSPETSPESSPARPEVSRDRLGDASSLKMRFAASTLRGTRDARRCDDGVRICDVRRERATGGGGSAGFGRGLTLANCSKVCFAFSTTSALADEHYA
jgi:hypothetical protein